MQFGPLKPVGLKTPNRNRARRCRPAANGKCPSHLLQLGRLSDQIDLWGAEARVSHDPRARTGRVPPVWEPPSQYVHQFTSAPPEYPAVQSPQHTVFAGQLVGVEGYTESAAMGGLAGINAARALAGQPPITPPPTTAHGCLVSHITWSDPRHFQPMNTNFGLFPPLSTLLKTKRRSVAH